MVLVVDADRVAVDRMSKMLAKRNIEVHGFVDGYAALRFARRVRPDAILLESILPGMCGLELLQRLRAGGVDAPALFVAARAALEDKLAGLSAGADDYIAKPFEPDEVTARLEAVLRRYDRRREGQRRAVLTYSDMWLDVGTREVARSGHLIALTPTQFDLLTYLMLNAETVLSKPRILDHLWYAGPDGPDVNVVESCICQLRRKIDTRGPRLIHTVRGFGYVLRESR